MRGIAVLLAAGNGRKFWPYNEVRNKCAFPIANEPLIRRLSRQLLELGYAEQYVVIGTEEASIRHALHGLQGVTHQFVRQVSGPGGTTAALLSAVDSAGSAVDNGTIFAVYGDVALSTNDLQSLIETHSGTGVAASALCTPLNGERTIDWITAQPVEEHAGGGLTCRNIEGHGRDGSHRLTGVYLFEPQTLSTLRAQPGRMEHVPVGGMPSVEQDLADGLAMLTDEGADVLLLETKQPCADLDKPWHIFDATRVVLEELFLHDFETHIEPGATISDSAEISGPIHVGAGAVIGPRVVLKGPAWIEAGANVTNGAIIGAGVAVGSGSRVSDYCQVEGGSVIGRDCIVGHGGEFSGVMLNRSYIYHYSEIYGVLGMAVDIGAATVCGTLRFDDMETGHRISGRRELPREGSNATYFGDYSRTGVNVITQPGAKIGAYSCVGPGIVIYKDVPSRRLCLLKQEIIEKEWGPAHYGW